MTGAKDRYIELGKLSINEQLYLMVKDEAIPGTGIKAEDFWHSLEMIVARLSPENEQLLAHRNLLQQQINQWHKSSAAQRQKYKSFLQDIGYFVAAPDELAITTNNVDEEMATIAGPQLVVPLDNARYALNAANARWGSLYDALYGSDVISQANGCGKGYKYNPIRGDKVVRFVREFLDQHFPLVKSTHNHVVQYLVQDSQAAMILGDGSKTGLLYPEQFVGYSVKADKPDSLLLRNKGLHVDILFGEGYFIGRRDHAGIYDVLLESSVTAIMDCEDSVASVDTEDKLKVYRNWLGLMKGDLTETVYKKDTPFTRHLSADRHYLDPQGQPLVKHGRSLMLVRNCGSHLYTDAVLHGGEPIAETMLDAMITALAAKHDLIGSKTIRNSRTGSIYIVKPKMHGPDEVALANQLFDLIEDAIKLDPNTLKMGIMDEERRTSVNLKACIQEAHKRLVFINTGFLDRTGDDIHTNMEAGAMPAKEGIKKARWLNAYEESNVRIGIACSLPGKAQIGKGMWAMPDEMNAMLETKIQHLVSGASTAWVPSPTAATLHAIHYHRFDVFARQKQLAQQPQIAVDDMLEIQTMSDTVDHAIIDSELENCAQGILGYVSRWVGQGIGCSKVADINDVELMEDCATLRISSQLLANWLHHGIISAKQVRQAFAQMAVIVDRQNQDTAGYKCMAPDFDDSPSFQAAMELVFKGREQPNGYTEFILYKHRKKVKQEQAIG